MTRMIQLGDIIVHAGVIMLACVAVVMSAELSGPSDLSLMSAVDMIKTHPARFCFPKRRGGGPKLRELLPNATHCEEHCLKMIKDDTMTLELAECIGASKPKLQCVCGYSYNATTASNEAADRSWLDLSAAAAENNSTEIDAYTSMENSSEASSEASMETVRASAEVRDKEEEEEEEVTSTEISTESSAESSGSNGTEVTYRWMGGASVCRAGNDTTACEARCERDGRVRRGQAVLVEAGCEYRRLNDKHPTCQCALIHSTATKPMTKPRRRRPATGADGRRLPARTRQSLVDAEVEEAILSAFAL